MPDGATTLGHEGPLDARLLLEPMRRRQRQIDRVLHYHRNMIVAFLAGAVCGALGALRGLGGI